MASFLVKMSELTPKVVLKQMVYLQEQIDSEVSFMSLIRSSYGLYIVLHYSLRDAGSCREFDHQHCVE